MASLQREREREREREHGSTLYERDKREREHGSTLYERDKTLYDSIVRIGARLQSRNFLIVIAEKMTTL